MDLSAFHMGKATCHLCKDLEPFYLTLLIQKVLLLKIKNILFQIIQILNNLQHVHLMQKVLHIQEQKYERSLKESVSIDAKAVVSFV